MGKRPEQNLVFAVALCAAALANGTTNTVVAQSAPRTSELTNLVVTATRLPTSPDRVGSSVTVISGDELESKHTTFVADAIRRVPGLAVGRAGGYGHLSQIRVRGAEGNHTLVLIDGIEVNDIGFNSEFDFGNLLTDNIDRIEILRGPQSTLWGGDAIGGVINIITKKGQGSPGGTAFVEAGSFQTGRASATISGADSLWSYSFNASRFQSHGISHANENNGNRETDGHDNDSFIGRIGVQALNGLSLEAVARYRDSTLETDPQTFNLMTFLSDPPADGITRTDGIARQGRITATADLFDGLAEAIVSAQYADTDTIQRNQTFGTPTFLSDAKRTKFEAQTNVRLNDNHTIVAGTETEEEEIVTSTQTQTDVEIHAVYAQYLLYPLPNVDISAGIRRDDHQSFGKQDTYRLTASYLFEQTSTRFKGSYGTGFKVPQLGELFGFFGNPNLQPETSDGWDIGVVQDFWGDRVRAEVVYFANDISNLIIFTGGTLQNAGESEIVGVETALSFTPTAELDLTLSYTWTDATDKSTGRELVRRPRHVASLDAAWQFTPRWKSTLSVTYTGEQDDLDFSKPAAAQQVTLEAFTKVDVTLAYHVTDRYEIYGRIENLLDEDYEEVVDYGVPGLGGFIGVRANF